jgi:HSP20 family protein
MHELFAPLDDWLPGSPRWIFSPHTQCQQWTDPWVVQSYTIPRELPASTFMDKDDYVIRIDAPGIPRDKIEISAEGTILTVTVVREPPVEDKATVREIHYGKFARQFTLAKEAATDRISASYADGVLEVRVPLVNQKKRIEVKFGMGA